MQKDASRGAAHGAPHDAIRHGGLDLLPRRTYRFRILGMGLAFLPLAAVLLELQAGWASWAWIIFGGLVWPHLAYRLALRSRDPFKAELRNFVIDSALAGSWVPLMHFNLLPSAVLLTVVTADKVNSGVRGLWLRSLPGLGLALLLVGAMTGFALQPETSMAVLVACLPILVIHTLAVSMSSYQLVRRVQRQNIQLEALTRVDALTGLDARRHWENQAEVLLGQHAHDRRPASLILVDIDRFKSINDQHGHVVGDDVLRAIAGVLREQLPADSHVGRLGGDELVAAVHLADAEAMQGAEAVCAAVERLRFPRAVGLRCSVSIGLASPPAGALHLREWIEAADHALYRAKHAGRNRAVGSALAAGNDDARASRASRSAGQA